MLRPTILALALAACRASPAPQLPVAPPAVAAAVCGNGIVESGEVCDPNVIWSARCPEPWGMCWNCAPSCLTWVPTNSELIESVEQDAYCTQDIQGGSTARTYDPHGFLLTNVQRWDIDSAHATHDFHRTPDGTIIGVDSDYVSTRAELHNRTRFELDAQHRRIRTWDELTPGIEYRFQYADDGPVLRFFGGRSFDGVLETDRRYTYDFERRLISDEATFGDSTWHQSTIHRYDRFGRETDEILGSSHEQAQPAYDCHTDYSPTGSERCCRFSSPPTHSCKTMDLRGSLVASTYHAPTGSLSERVQNVYDARGLLLEATSHNGDGTFSYAEHRAYDARGLLLTTERVHREGEAAVVTTKRTYDCLEPVFSQMPKRTFAERR